MVKLGKIFLLLTFLPLSAFSKVSVKSVLSTPNVGVGDQVRISIEYKSKVSAKELEADLRPPQSVSNNALDLIDTNTSISQGFNISNGKTTRSYTRTITLTYAAFKEGLWTIPKFNLGLGDEKTAGPFKVRVYKELPEKYKQKNQNQGSGIFGGLFDQMINGGRLNRTQSSKVEFFAEAEVDKTTIYEGEQLYVRFYIYTTGVVTQFDTLKFPTFEGFWKEDVNFAGRFVWKPFVKDGKKMQRAELSSYILIPYKAGPHEIDSFELRTSIRPSRFSFNRSSKSFKMKTKPIAINVLPLEGSKPDSYLGGVGLFASGVVGGRGRREVLEGESFKLQLKVVGDESSTKFTDVPKIDLGEDFKLLSQKEEYRFFPQNLSSMKVFTYNLIGRKPGVYKIPDVVMSFHKAYDESVAESGDEKFYEVIQELPTLKVRKNTNIKKMEDESYFSADDEPVKWLPFSSNVILAFLSLKVPFIFYILLFFMLTGFAYAIFIKEVNKNEEDRSLFEKLKEHSLNAKKEFKAGDFRSSALSLINYYYLVVGGITGKRLSTEEEFKLSLASLPAGLKSQKAKILETMQELQALRFGSDLSLKENQDKLKRCIQKQILDSKNLEAYIS